jgi:23S rRNA (pseudouridine1915-N3)-methyltransferase
VHHLTVLAVGRLKEPHLRALCDDFQSRLSRYAKVRVMEVKDASGDAPEAVMAEEAAALEAKRPAGFGLVALDRTGRDLSSDDLAEWLARRAGAGQSRWAFTLGGPWGLHPPLVRRADLCLSLSRLTFTHELARLLLLEQLYRAMTILRGEPYHK